MSGPYKNFHVYSQSNIFSVIFGIISPTKQFNSFVFLVYRFRVMGGKDLLNEQVFLRWYQSLPGGSVEQNTVRNFLAALVLGFLSTAESIYCAGTQPPSKWWLSTPKVGQQYKHWVRWLARVIIWLDWLGYLATAVLQETVTLMSFLGQILQSH